MEFEEFVKKKHWYTSFWADIAYVTLGVLALLFIFGTQYATGEFGFSISNMFEKKTESLPMSQPAPKVENPPKVSYMTPVSGDPSVKIDSPIKITFDKPTKGYDVNFVVEPFSDFDLSYDDSKKDFTIQSKAKFDYARDYAVSVRIAPTAAKLQAKDMPEIYRANFKTENELVVVPDPAPNAVVPSETVEAKIADGKYIDINLAKQNLSMFENGEILGTYKVSTGKRGMATPTGTFKVMSKTGRAYSKKYNLFMPFWMQFTGAGHGIHELPEWKSGYKEGANHLGTPVSHGCVRLGVGPAKTVYNWSDTGTPIVIHY